MKSLGLDLTGGSRERLACLVSAFADHGPHGAASWLAMNMNMYLTLIGFIMVDIFFEVLKAYFVYAIFTIGQAMVMMNQSGTWFCGELTKWALALYAKTVISQWQQAMLPRVPFLTSECLAKYQEWKNHIKVNNTVPTLSEAV